MMIINKIYGDVISPTKKQNKYLLSIGATSSYGANYNGYGYADTVRIYELQSEQMAEYNRIGNLPTKKNKIKTQEEKIKSRAKRLDKLTQCGLDFATSIAKSKIEYKLDCINAMIERDNILPSVRRGKLIKKMERENPLRPIVDIDHANNILSAHQRHNDTNYDYNLAEAYDLGLKGKEKKEKAYELTYGAI